MNLAHRLPVWALAASAEVNHQNKEWFLKQQLQTREDLWDVTF